MHSKSTLTDKRPGVVSLRKAVVSSLMIALIAGTIGYLSAPVASVRLNKPRIAPVVESEWDEAQRELLKPYAESNRLINVFTTMAQHPDLARDWIVFGTHILSRSTLPPRERELLILRIGWLCQAEYEWAQHARIGLSVGISEEEIVQITEGPDAAGWNTQDATLLRAVDELHEEAFVSDKTWNALAKRFDQKQMMDLVFTVGQYNLVSMALNSFGVQLDPGLEGFPK